VFVHGKPFQPSQMSVCKAGTYPIEEPFRCSTIGQAPGLAKEIIDWARKLRRKKSFITLGSDEVLFSPKIGAALYSLLTTKRVSVNQPI
jgi:hypothetical protein